MKRYTFSAPSYNLSDGRSFLFWTRCECSTTGAVQGFLPKRKDVTIIHLLNGQTMELKDEYFNNDQDYKTLLYTLKGCFFKEKYLIYSDFMPDSEARITHLIYTMDPIHC